MTVSLGWIPSGRAGTEVTVKRMADAVRESLTDPTVRDTALAIIRGCPGRDYPCQVGALRRWLAARFRFRRDPHRLEWVVSPVRQLAYVRGQGFVEGDCDDAAVLAAALGEAVGFPARLAVLGFLGPAGPFGHVFTELGVSSPPAAAGWYELDVTRSLATPQLPPSRLAYYPVE